jgi:hypothetical protein
MEQQQPLVLLLGIVEANHNPLPLSHARRHALLPKILVISTSRSIVRGVAATILSLLAPSSRKAGIVEAHHHSLLLVPKSLLPLYYIF